MLVGCLCERSPINRRACEVLQPTDTIVATCKNLEHELAHLVVRRGEAAREQVLQGLRAGYQHTYPLIAIGGSGVLREVREVRLHLPVDLVPGLLEHWLVEVTEANLACEVVDSRVASIRRQKESIEEGAHFFGGRQSACINMLKSPLEDGHDRSQLLINALMRLIHPQ